MAAHLPGDEPAGFLRVAEGFPARRGDPVAVQESFAGAAVGEQLGCPGTGPKAANSCCPQVIGKA